MKRVLKQSSNPWMLLWLNLLHSRRSLKGILDKFEIIGIEGRGAFMLDREIGNLLTK